MTFSRVAINHHLRSPDVALGNAWSGWLLWIIVVIGIVDAVWLLVTPITLSESSILTACMIVCWTPLGFRLAAQARGYPRLQTLFFGGTMLLTAWPTLRLLNHLTMTTGFPIADSQLAAWDAAIGFDWLSYLHWLDQRPGLLQVMRLCYGSLTEYSVVIFIILVLSREAPIRCLEFFRLFVLTSLSCIAIGLFFPALAAAEFYEPTTNVFHNLRPYAGAYHVASLHELRTNPHVLLDLNRLPGLVTFPSFHTALGVVVIYCARWNPWLFGLSLSVNSVMIASTPLYGSHYLIDVIAGAAVAGLAITCLRYDLRVRLLSTENGGLGRVVTYTRSLKLPFAQSHR
jgi:hypothetical protein